MTNKQPDRSVEEPKYILAQEWLHATDQTTQAMVAMLVERANAITKDQTLQTERQKCEEWYIGKKVQAFGEEYIVVGISTMIYDEDCEGEPEWKITKEVQEIAIAKDYDEISFQKPSWHSLQALTPPNNPK